MANGIPFLGAVGQIESTVALLVADVEGVLNLFGAPQWGLFLNGAQIVIPDSIFAVEFKSDWRISDYPQEAGSFQSYNKVRAPYDAKVTMTQGGPNLGNFLLAIEAAAASLDLYDLVTPDRSYPSANIEHFDYKRTAQNGASLLTVDVWLKEVRVTATTGFSNTANPDDADPSNTGAVQGTPPTSDQAAAMPDADGMA